ncbi:MAG: hypothetical protein SFV15_15765 [Polyangiaceae bacterium]|nr:hypothetical protein [Polyangiaceae bacterium]
MAQQSSAAALVAYAETLFQGGRVLLVGNSASRLPELFLARGAASVCVWDPDATRAARSARPGRSEVTVEALAAEPGRHRGFDLLFVEDLASIKEPAELLRRGKRSLARRGAALIVCENVDAVQRLLPSISAAVSELDYYSLYDTVAALFPVVRMLGQAPFVGYAVADFATDGTPVPSVDTTLLKSGAEQPETFIALASFEAIELEAFSLVQLPLAELGLSFGDSQPSAVAQEELRRITEENATLAASLKLMTTERDRAKVESIALRDATAALRIQQGKAEEELGRQRSVAEAAQAAARKAAEETQAAARKIAEEAEAKAKRAASEAELRAQKQIEGAEARAQKLIEESRAKAQGLVEDSVAKVQARIAELENLAKVQAERLATYDQVKDVDGAVELARFEEQLRSQASELNRLESELSQARTVGRALVLELEVAKAESSQPLGTAAAAEAPNADLAQKLADAQQQAAVREADYQVLLWTIDRLEEKLGLGVSNTDDPARQAASALTQRQAALGYQVKAETRN